MIIETQYYISAFYFWTFAWTLIQPSQNLLIDVEPVEKFHSQNILCKRKGNHSVGLINKHWINLGLSLALCGLGMPYAAFLFKTHKDSRVDSEQLEHPTWQNRSLHLHPSLQHLSCSFLQSHLMGRILTKCSGASQQNKCCK